MAFSHGQGTKVEVGRGTSAIVWAELDGIRDVQLPTAEIEEIDITHMGSNGVREYTSGLRDNGEVTYELLFDEASTTHTLLQSIADSRETVQLRISFGTLVKTFVAFVKTYEITLAYDDVNTSSVTFRISAEVV